MRLALSAAGALMLLAAVIWAVLTTPPNGAGQGHLKRIDPPCADHALGC